MATQAFLFVLDALVGFFTVVLLLRFFMQVARVSFGNQLGAFVVQLTNWLVKPLRRVIPGVAGLDLASLLPAYLLQCLLLAVVLGLRGAAESLGAGTFAGLVAWQGLLATLRSVVYLYVGALFLLAILSWVNPFSPLAAPVGQLTRPVLDPIRRVLPPIANVDLSPLVAILLAQVLLMFL